MRELLFYFLILGLSTNIAKQFTALIMGRLFTIFPTIQWRIQRWPNIKTSLFQRVVFAGNFHDKIIATSWSYHHSTIILTLCLSSHCIHNMYGFDAIKSTVLWKKCHVRKSTSTGWWDGEPEHCITTVNKYRAAAGADDYNCGWCAAIQSLQSRVVHATCVQAYNQIYNPPIHLLLSCDFSVNLKKDYTGYCFGGSWGSTPDSHHCRDHCHDLLLLSA